MSMAELELRTARLEQQVAELTRRIDASGSPGVNDWIDKIHGTFANDPIYDEAMALGRKWRESHRPKPRRRKSARGRVRKVNKG